MFCAAIGFKVIIIEHIEIKRKLDKIRLDLIHGSDTMQPEKSQNSHTVLTVAEVAELFRVHRSTISRYARSGELKSYVLGNRRLFKSEDVWSFFENQVAQECVFGKEAR